MIIKTIKQAKENIGRQAWWDDISNRYHFIRTGYLEGVQGKNLLIDGDYKWLPSLRSHNLRTTQTK